MCGLFGIRFASGVPYAQRESIIQLSADAMTNRGRQSWGLAFTEPGQSPRMVRGIGEMSDTEVGAIARRAGYVIGHTRLATDGAVKVENCHPFRLRSSLVKAPMYVAHNGMVYNWHDHKQEGDEVDSIVLARHVAAGASPDKLDGYGTVVALSHKGIHWARLDGGDLDRVHVYDDDGRQVAALLISSVGGERARYDILASLRELGFEAAQSTPVYNRLSRLAMRPKNDHVEASSFALAPSMMVRDYSRTRGSDAAYGATLARSNFSSWADSWGTQLYTVDDIVDRIERGSLTVTASGRVEFRVGVHKGRYVPGETAPAGMWSTRRGDPTELVSRYGTGEIDISDETDALSVLEAAAHSGAADGGQGWAVLIEAWSLISGEAPSVPSAGSEAVADVVDIRTASGGKGGAS
jgi:hypothetical protein